MLKPILKFVTLTAIPVISAYAAMTYIAPIQIESNLNQWSSRNIDFDGTRFSQASINLVKDGVRSNVDALAVRLVMVGAIAGGGMFALVWFLLNHEQISAVELARYRRWRTAIAKNDNEELGKLELEQREWQEVSSRVN